MARWVSRRNSDTYQAYLAMQARQTGLKYLAYT